MDPRTSTIQFGRWLTAQWALDLRNWDDGEFLRFTCLQANAIILDAHDGTLDDDETAERLRKMYTAATIHAKKRGKVHADLTMDAFRAMLLAAVQQGFWAVTGPDRGRPGQV